MHHLAKRQSLSSSSKLQLFPSTVIPTNSLEPFFTSRSIIVKLKEIKENDFGTGVEGEAWSPWLFWLNTRLGVLYHGIWRAS